MTTKPNAIVEDIPLIPTPAQEIITPGRRIRLVNIKPACFNGLTGTTQANPASRSTTRLDVLLDHSSTEFLRHDVRAINNAKVRVPAPSVTRMLLKDAPTDCMLLAENDN